MSHTSPAARPAHALARHAPALALCAALLTALLAYPMLMWAPTEVASTTPQTPMFEAAARARERLEGAAYVMSFVVEAPEGESLLSAPHVRQLHAALSAARANPALAPKLQRYYSTILGLELHGALSVGDLVAQALAARGLTLADAPDALVEEAAQGVAERLAATPSQLLILSGRSHRDAQGRWRVPGALMSALGDREALGAAGGDITLSEVRPARELFARELRDALRAHAGPLRVHGVALDVNLSKQEQGEASGPLLALALLLNIGLIALSFRSYWAVTLMGLGVATMMVWLKGGSNLLGLKSDTILSLIVPIAMVSFGVDAGVHAVARYREERRGLAPLAAGAAGLTGVLGALCVAALTDLSAFLVNLTSPLESVRQFGLAASLALLSSLVTLGVLCPLLLARVEQRAEEAGVRLGAAARGALVALAALAASVVALACWLLSPAVALALYALYVLLCVLLPWGWLAWRGRGAPRAPLALAPLALAPSLPARLGGRLAEGLTALLWSSPRAVVLSCAALTGAALPLALGVRVEFNIRQLLSPTSELVVGLDKLDEHLTGRGGESSQVVVEGPLARPETLAALERAVLDLRALRSAALVQRGGETRVEGGLVDLWRLERAARPEATLTPALLRRWRDEGAPTSQERPEYTPPEAREVLWAREGAGDGAGAAAGWGVTRLTVQLARTQSSEGIYEAAEALAPAVRRLDEALRALHPEARATLTGGALLRQGELDAVTASMVSSMPIALALCFVITAAAMRSVGRALACVVTLCAVVLWLFALMRLLGYGLNFMSATLGSLAMGVGIDYATHTAMRLDERRAPGGGLSREALAEALGGTGLALCVSALSSVCGFAALTLAPMPLFSSYGLFTAVMVSLALLASLTLLPALLVLPSRLGR